MPIQLLPALIVQSAHAKTARVKVITQAAAKAIIVANQTPSHSNRTNTTRTVDFFTESKQVEEVFFHFWKCLKDLKNNNNNKTQTCCNLCFVCRSCGHDGATVQGGKGWLYCHAGFVSTFSGESRHGLPSTISSFSYAKVIKKKY